MAAKVKIDAPNQLPPSGITPIKYKQWKVALKIFLHQTAEFRQYYPGGKYTTWTAMEDNPHRIVNLAVGDVEPEGTTKEEHLAQRRINLETFLGIIARYSDEGDFDEIMERSTSLEWIFTLHERRYGIQKKGRHFNRIHEIRFDKSTMSDHNKFYNDLRACFKSNMRKAGDKIKYKNCTLTEDEKITPTTECLIIYMALERIDSRLPNEIDRIFGHRMDDNVTLIDLQTEIFSYIPRALATLDREEMQADLNAYYVNSVMNEDSINQLSQEATKLDINAIYGRQQMRTRGLPNKQSSNGFKGKSYPSKQHKGFCRLCHALDLPVQTCQTHNTEQCRKRALLQEINILTKNNQDDDYSDEDEAQQDI